MRLGRDWCTPVIEVSKIDIGVSVPELWQKISPRAVGSIIKCRRTSMTRSAASCKSHDMRATRIMIVLILMLSMFLLVDASGRYRGVSKRKDSVFYHCEATFLGTSPRVKVWVGTYSTEELAALACDVFSYYTNRPANEFNLKYSEDAIRLHCKARSAYENLHNWDDRRKFIKGEANRLISLLSSADQAPELRWEDVAVSPLVSVRQRARELAGTIIEHFCNQAERLQEFMTWFMHISYLAAQLTPMGYSQTQHGEASICQDLPLGGDRIFDEHRVALLLESLASRRGGAWLSLIAGSLAVIFQMFNDHTESNAWDVGDASISLTDAKLTDRKKCQNAAKRQKVEHPSIQVFSATTCLANFLKTNAEDVVEASIFPNDAMRTYRKKRQSEPTKRAAKRQKNEHRSIQPVSDRVQTSLTAITFDVENEAWKCTGYDLLSKTWRTLTPFPCLPGPDLRLYEGRFKKYSVSGHGGLMCANVSNPPNEGDVVVFNPLTGKKRALPPLLHPRNPVLLHMLVDSATKSYKVIVAGSLSSTDEHLSKKMEVFDSKTSKWEETCDLPGPAFGHRTGVCVNGILYFTSFLEGEGCRKGVVAFDVENGEWLPSMTCPLPCPLSSGIAQLVENDGKVYLFYEHQERYEHCIDVLEMSEPNAGAVTCQWRNVVRVENCTVGGFKWYHKYACVGLGEGKLCIYNTSEGNGMVYDTGSGIVSEVLEPHSDRRSLRSIRGEVMNPISFTLQLSSEIDPTPPSVDDIHVGRTLLVHPFLQ